MSAVRCLTKKKKKRKLFEYNTALMLLLRSRYLNGSRASRGTPMAGLCKDVALHFNCSSQIHTQKETNMSVPQKNYDVSNTHRRYKACKTSTVVLSYLEKVKPHKRKQEVKDFQSRISLFLSHFFFLSLFPCSKKKKKIQTKETTNFSVPVWLYSAGDVFCTYKCAQDSEKKKS